MNTTTYVLKKKVPCIRDIKIGIEFMLLVVGEVSRIPTYCHIGRNITSYFYDIYCSSVPDFKKKMVLCLAVIPTTNVNPDKIVIRCSPWAMSFFN